MQTFTDNEGRTWTLKLTLGSAERVKALVGVDLLEPCLPGDTREGDATDPPLLTRLGTEVALLCDVIFALIKPEADERGVTDEGWAEAMGGDAILEAQKAFYEELVGFFQMLGRRDVVKAAATQQRMIELVIRANEERIDAVDPETEVARLVESTRAEGSTMYGDLPTNSGPSPESTPDATR
ncbi:MAG: hypothetical protein R6X33_18100 [Candidatus Brocadiia bacterium]